MRRDGFKAVRIFVRECLYIVIYSISYVIGILVSLVTPKSQRFKPWEMVKGKPIVILIHGLLGGPYHFWFMRRRLRAMGIPNVVLFEYGSLTGDIDDHVERLRDFLILIRSKTGMCESILVGHSLGGIVSHEYAANMARVARSWRWSAWAALTGDREWRRWGLALQPGVCIPPTLYFVRLSTLK